MKLNSITRRLSWPPFFFVTILCLSLSCEDQSKSVIDYTDACPILDSVDLQMNKLVQDLVVEYNTHPQFIRNLKQSQVMWTQYRNTTVKVFMDLDERPRDYSEDQKNCKCEKMAQLTINRINELEIFRGGLSDDISCW